MLKILILIFLAMPAFGQITSKVKALTQEMEAINTPIEAGQCADPTELTPPLRFHFASVAQNKLTMDCKSLEMNGCEYEQCIAPEGMLNSYPKQVAILIPKTIAQVTQLKVHFHGFTTFQNKWDKSLSDLTSSFEFGNKVCENKSEALIVPFSKNNKNTDFINHLYNATQFNKFIAEIEKLTQSNKPAIRLSGHSGGGKILANILNTTKYNDQSVDANQRVIQAEVFDGLYAQGWADKLANWYGQNENVQLKLNAIEATTTGTWSHYLEKKFKATRPIQSHYEKNRGGHHHWEIVRDNWN